MSGDATMSNYSQLPVTAATVATDNHSALTTLLWNVTSGDINDTTATSLPGGDGVTSLPSGGDEDCVDWQEAQHVLFQLASLCFAGAFVVPSTLGYHVVALRGGLILGGFLILLWASTVVCQRDVLGWYLVFILVNAAHLSHYSYNSWPVAFQPEVEDLYVKTFKPLRWTRYQFRDLVRCGSVKDLPSGASYALEHATHVGEKLSILLCGRLKVTCDRDLYLHSVEPCQFVDSVEYEAKVPVDDSEHCFQVSYRAAEDSRLLTWPARELRLFLDTRPYMKVVFTNLLGKDITHKLYQVQEMLLSHPQYVRVIANRNSVVHVRHKMGQGMSPSRGMNGLARQLSPVGSLDTSSPTSSRHTDTSRYHVKFLDQLQGSSGRRSPRVATPVGPYSPSQVSFETCV